MVESSSIITVRPMSTMSTFEKLSGNGNEFVCGIPKSKYFNYTRKKAVVIAVSDYSELRKNPGKERYEDLNETLDDVKNINKDLKILGFN